MNSLRFVIIILIFIVTEIYGYKAINSLTENSGENIKLIAKSVYIGAFFIVIAGFSILFFFREFIFTYKKINIFLLLGGLFVVLFVPKLFIVVFELIQDASKLISYFIKSISPNDSQVYSTADKISRSVFISRAGLIVAAIPFLGFLWGMFHERYNFTVSKIKAPFKNLPKSFKNFKIVQISDLHLGNFGGADKFSEAVKLINKQNPDIVVITGDIVNILASELDDYIPELNKIKAKYGKFAVLGNHDYGEYYRWKSESEQKNNFLALIDNYKKTSFRLLLNESVVIEKDNEQIAVLGIENWGLPPFPQYGDFDKAKLNTDNIPFKILLSHDPTFWDENITDKEKIDLTLSGHTHGMQIAVNIPGVMKWSPVQYKYPRWSGLYKHKEQLLYVNVGLGVVGYPGRIGTPPEITVIELI
ncbi:MAG: metallophosphoesterase [bacterium]|nr:metallophosphoesterase [bacterium]